MGLAATAAGSLCVIAAPTPARVSKGLVQLRIDASVERDGTTLVLDANTPIRSGDKLTLNVTSSQRGFISIVNYGPANVVYPMCPELAEYCPRGELMPEVTYQAGPFAISGKHGWEWFDLALTATQVDPSAHQPRFANDESQTGQAGQMTRKSILREKVADEQIWYHDAAVTARYFPAGTLYSVSFSLYHEPPT